jgi:hypothetical protein
MIFSEKPLHTFPDHAPDRDKVMTRPYLGREAVSFSSILHDDLKGRTAAAG